MYSILADKDGQLAIVIRYVDLQTAIQHKRFLTYV